MLKGILYILIACLIWGLIFVIPGFMVEFHPLEIALGRYFFFGVTSCVFMMVKGFRKWKNIPRSIWQQAISYALLVNILYYFSLVTGLKYSSASVITLLLGLSPITVAFYGNWRQKECSYKQLIVPSVLIGIGLLCVNWPALQSLSSKNGWEYGFGLLCGVFSLIVWNWYMVANSQFLKNNPSVSSSDWSSLIGIGTFFWVILIMLMSFLIFPSHYFFKYTLLNSSLSFFLFGSLILGLVCSWLGSYLWNKGSQQISFSLASQLTIFETIFGLIFVYCLDQTFPPLIELLGISIILSGIGFSMHLFRSQTYPMQEIVHA